MILFWHIDLKMQTGILRHKKSLALVRTEDQPENRVHPFSHRMRVSGFESASHRLPFSTLVTFWYFLKLHNAARTYQWVLCAGFNHAENKYSELRVCAALLKPAPGTYNKSTSGVHSTNSQDLPMTNLLNNNQSRRQFVRRTLLSAGGILLTSVARALAETGSTGLEAGELDRPLGAFAKSIQGNVLLVSDVNYDRARRPMSFNSLTDKYPAIIAQCKTADDVARSVEFARANSLEIAVKSGGCDIMGQSSCQGGMLIDLSFLQDVEVRAEDRIVRMGAGVKCGTLEYKLSDAGLVVPLSCNPMVGVSGLTLGGGMGWVSGKHGMTADNVVAMDVITAEGKQLRVSDKQNQDLFWALRGGGGNFGIVTAFEYQAYPLTEVYGGHLIYPMEMLGEFLQFYRGIMADAPDELMIELSIAPTNPPMLVATVCYSGDEASSRAVLSSVREFGPPAFDGIRAVKLNQISAITKEARDFLAASAARAASAKPDAGSPIERDGYYNHWRAATIPEWTDSAINTFVTSIEKAPVGWSMGVGHYMHGASCAVGAQAAPIVRDEHRSSYFFNMSWGHSSQTEDSMAWVDQSIKDMQPHNSAGTYVNYLSSNAPEAVAASYGTNYSRLQKLKSQYDSENIFHLNRNIRA